MLWPLLCGHWVLCGNVGFVKLLKLRLGEVSFAVNYRKLTNTKLIFFDAQKSRVYGTIFVVII